MTHLKKHETEAGRIGNINKTMKEEPRNMEVTKKQLEVALARLKVN